MKYESIFTFPPEGKMTVGKRYCGPTGVEIIITRSGNSIITDGETVFQQKESMRTLENVSEIMPSYEMQVGKRFGEVDPINGQILENGVEALVIKPGKANIRCNGFNMELITPKILPSAD